jgi:glutamyl-tRNA synthetase
MSRVDNCRTSISVTVPPIHTTRLAPSPTGALHLGNARTFLVNWAMARQAGWGILLRIEDLDGPRIRKGADLQAMEDLRWLGIDWDQGPVYQSSRMPLYRRAVDQLLAGGWAYPCICSRSEIEQAASAPHAEDGAAVYPGTCRGRFGSIEQASISAGREPALRFAIPDRTLSFTDGFAGPQQFDLGAQLGDFVIAKGDRSPAYQLAVVVDDAEMNITQVVRGDDLIDSTPRQMLLYEALGIADRIPRYHHLPLVVGPDGRRLAKRHGDTRISRYRGQGMPPGRLIALLGRWCGIEATSAAEFLHRFDLARLPKQRIIFSEP